MEVKIPENIVVIDNIEYSVDYLEGIHPGGDLFVKAFAGRDASEAFLSYHRRPFPHQKYGEGSKNPTTNVIGDLRSPVGTEGSNLEHLRCSEETFGHGDRIVTKYK